MRFIQPISKKVQQNYQPGTPLSETLKRIQKNVLWDPYEKCSSLVAILIYVFLAVCVVLLFTMISPLGFAGHMLMVLFSGVLGYMGYLLYDKANKLLALRRLLLAMQDIRKPVLYLRYFAVDNVFSAIRPADSITHKEPFRTKDELSTEGILAKRLATLGPFVGLGSPGEGVAATNVVRLFVNSECWQESILELMRSSQLIVFRYEARENLQWELKTIISEGYLHKLALFVVDESGYPLDKAGYIRLRNSIVEAGFNSALNLPEKAWQSWFIYFTKTDTQNVFKSNIISARFPKNLSREMSSGVRKLISQI